MHEIMIHSHPEAISVMRDLYTTGKIASATAGLRHFPKGRLSLIRRTGTDRSKDAHIYHIEGDFQGDQNKRPDEIIYLREVAFLEEPPISIPLTRAPLPHIDNMNYLSTLSHDTCQSIYDLSQLYRAADNEFWFLGNPMSVLIAVLIVR